MNDLIGMLDSAPEPPPTRSVRGKWKATFLDTSSARLHRDWGPMLARLRIEGFEVHVLAPDDGGLIALEEQGCLVKPIPSLESDIPNPAAWLGAFVILQGHLYEHPSALLHTRGLLASLLGALAAQTSEVFAQFASVEDHRFLTDQPCASRVAPLGSRLGARLGEAARALPGDSFERAWRWLGAQVGGYIVHGKQDAELLTSRGLVSPDLLEVLPAGQGVELSRFDPDHIMVPTQARAREQLGVPATWRHVLGVAGVIEAPREIARVASALAQRVPSAGWLLAEPAGGFSSGAMAALEPLISSQRAQVVVPGLDMPRFYTALDVFVSPRYREGVATSVLEASAMRVPAVAYRTRASASVIEDGGSGALVEPGDLVALTDALVEMLEHPTRVATYGGRARTLARQRYGREAAHERTLAFFDRVLSEQLDA